MTFITEWLDEDGRRENDVNVTNWVIDKDRNIALWINGKHWQARAEGDYSESVMLRIKDKKFRFELMPDKNYRHYVQGEVHHYIWDKVIEYWPKDLYGYSCEELLCIIKEALIVEGGGGLSNQDHPNFTVSFKF